MVIVTGLNRTGTSMMMQVLGHLGFNLHQTSFADEMNPDGYFECQESQAGIDTSMFPDSIAAKIFIETLVLRSRLQPKDKIIACIRHPDSVLNSKMREVTEAMYLHQMRMLKGFIDNHEAFRVERPLVIDYDLMLFRPYEEISSIAWFLGLPYGTEETEMAIKRAAGIVKPREKISIYNRLLLEVPGPVME